MRGSNYQDGGRGTSIAEVPFYFDAIVGFEMEILSWRPTAKLSQNKPQAARDKAADELDAVGRRAIAHMMRQFGQT